MLETGGDRFRAGGDNLGIANHAPSRKIDWLAFKLTRDFGQRPHRRHQRRDRVKSKAGVVTIS